jgi:tetratricopeptide (TPR) repeat protein
MHHLSQRPPLQIIRFLLPLLACFLLTPLQARSQDSGSEGTMLRGNRAEIAVTIHDGAGEALNVPANVRIYKDGMPADQKEASHGRAFFILRALGDYTVRVDASGYKTAQRDESIRALSRYEIDIYLQKEGVVEGASAVPGRPLLAPNAKEAFEKGLQALSENKLDEAEKHIGQAIKLAPGNPDVLYAQGVLYLRRRNWTQAESTLEKATEIDPNLARAFAALGMTLSNEGKYDAAISPLEKSLQLDPTGTWEARWALSKAYYHHGQFEEALKTSQQALADSKGKAPEIELLVAQSLTAVGRYEDSAQELREFLKNYGDRPEAATAKRFLERLTADGKIRRN